MCGRIRRLELPLESFFPNKVLVDWIDSAGRVFSKVQDFAKRGPLSIFWINPARSSQWCLPVCDPVAQARPARGLRSDC